METKIPVSKQKECNCLSQVKKKILEKVKADSKAEGYRIVESGFERESWFPVTRLYSAFLIKSTFTKKDGTESKPKNEHVSVFYTFCPFCGKAFPKVK